MYTLSNVEIKWFDLARAADFVSYWEPFYDYSVKVFESNQEIDYFAELNLLGDLTRQNLERLLRWKDPHRLTEQTMSGPRKGQRNAMVDRAINTLPMLNRLRRGDVAEADARAAVSGVFPTGVVFQVFLLHIARPQIYPIADQHVFRAYGVHRAVKTPHTWDTYAGYRAYFSEIAQTMGVAQTADRVRGLKRIDNALMAYGQFLKKYHR